MICVGVGLASGDSLAQAQITIQGGWSTMLVWGFSADGTTLVGSGNPTTNSNIHPWRWRVGSPIENLSPTGGVARRASFDGSYVAIDGPPHGLYLWHEGVAEPFNLTGWPDATAVSDDGQTVLGVTDRFTSGTTWPFVWTRVT